MLLKNRYRLVQLIAHGRFGKTFRAVDQSQSPPLSCIVKQFLPDNLTPFALKKATNLFEQKALKLKELGEHPQIPALLDYFEADGEFYLVQELIDGVNLAKIVELDGVFQEFQVWQLLADLLPVLKFIHARNVIHRDIKPENIIRTQSKAEPWGMRSQAEPGNEDVGGVVLVGFGVGNSIGSAEYVAPEQAQSQAVFASDLYSLGVTCIYLLTGVSPFNLFDSANNCWAWGQYVQVSDRLSFILNKLIQNNLSDRFQSADEAIQLLDQKPKTKNPKSKIQNLKSKITLTGHAGLFAGVNSVAISPDNRILASGSDDKTIRLWDIEKGEEIATLLGHTNFVQSVAFSPDGTLLASGSDDKTIKLWNLETHQEICTLSEHTRAVKSLAFSPPSPTPPLPYSPTLLLASGSWDKTIKLWDLNTKKVICTLKGHQLQVSCVTFSPDGHFLASASFDKTVRLWDMRNLEVLQTRPVCQILSGHTWPVFAVAFSPNNQMLATGSDDKTIKLWNVKTGREICTLSGHTWSVVALAFSPDGQTLISGSCDQTIKLWNVRTGKEINTLAGHIDAVSAVAISSNGQLVASGSKDKTVKLWQLMP